jgi:hypothetical protein
MEEQDIKQLWRAYDVKLERSLQLNYKIIREMQTQQAEEKISSFRRNQVFGVVGGIIWILFLVFLIVHALNNIYFVISVGFIALFNIFAVTAYIRHLAMLDKVNITDSITGAQQKLATIQTSLNNVGRILVLQTPFYCTFWYSQYLVDHGGTQFWVINLVIVALFIAASIYLFKTLTYKNIHRKWVKAFIESFGGKQIIKAMEFLNDIDDYKAEV